MKDISKDIIAKIKEKNLVPQSRFRLQWKNYVFWLLMIMMILFGAASASLVVFNMVDFDPRFLHHMKLYKFFRIIIFTAPYLWLILSFLALAFGVLAFRNTSRGYRKSLLFATSLAVLIISLLGVFGHIMKINKKMDEMMSKRISPQMRSFSGPREGRWARPGDGLIGGEIMEVSENNLILISFHDEKWKIIINEKTEKIDKDDISIGEKVGVIGEKIDEFVMQAFSIKKFPDDWDGRHPRRVLIREGRSGSPMMPMALPGE
ncbi:MAG: hypothetical protein ACD_15C00113G0020 [uncultured bacterium]|nr:MAG: hypothetical protein ACD_15C00113G0020 [uncultured bacterium]